MEAAMGTGDAIRAYVRTLRDGRATQQEVADHLGLSLRAFLGWERGETEDLKGPVLLRAVKFLTGSIDGDVLEQLVSEGADEARGRDLALKWLNAQPSDVRASIHALHRRPGHQRGIAAKMLNRAADLIDQGENPQRALRIASDEIDPDSNNGGA